MRNAADLLKIEINIRLQDLQRRKNGIAPLNPDEVTEVDNNLTTLLGIAEQYDADAKEISSNSDLSKQGKDKARAKLARETLQKISDFEAAHVTKPRERVAQLGSTILQKAKIQRPTDPYEWDLYRDRLNRLLDKLEVLDPIEVDLIAMTTTNPLVLDALAQSTEVVHRPDKNSPRTLVPLVNRERIDAAAVARARTNDPESAAAMEKLERLAECYAGSIGGVKSAIHEQLAADQETPVEVQAR